MLAVPARHCRRLPDHDATKQKVSFFSPGAPNVPTGPRTGWKFEHVRMNNSIAKWPFGDNFLCHAIKDPDFRNDVSPQCTFNNNDDEENVSAREKKRVEVFEKFMRQPRVHGADGADAAMLRETFNCLEGVMAKNGLGMDALMRAAKRRSGHHHRRLPKL